MGECLAGFAPHGRWRTLAFARGATLRGHHRALRLRLPINGIRFLVYIEQCLVAALRPGDIVIMDNLETHKAKAVRRAI